MIRGKAVIITGASRGIGREIAITLAHNGADLVINGNDMSALQEVQALVEAIGSRCEIVRGDIGNYETSQALADVCMKQYGKIDILVNNAGINNRTPF